MGEKTNHPKESDTVLLFQLKGVLKQHQSRDRQADQAVRQAIAALTLARELLSAEVLDSRLEQLTGGQAQTEQPSLEAPPWLRDRLPDLQ